VVVDRLLQLFGLAGLIDIGVPPPRIHAAARAVVDVAAVLAVDQAVDRELAPPDGVAEAEVEVRVAIAGLHVLGVAVLRRLHERHAPLIREAVYGGLCAPELLLEPLRVAVPLADPDEQSLVVRLELLQRLGAVAVCQLLRRAVQARRPELAHYHAVAEEHHVLPIARTVEALDA